MSGKSTKDRGDAGGESREERLRAALRANLARRKAQVRARSAAETDTPEVPNESEE